MTILVYRQLLILRLGAKGPQLRPKGTQQDPKGPGPHQEQERESVSTQTSSIFKIFSSNLSNLISRGCINQSLCRSNSLGTSLSKQRQYESSSSYTAGVSICTVMYYTTAPIYSAKKLSLGDVNNIYRVDKSVVKECQEIDQEENNYWIEDRQVDHCYLDSCGADNHWQDNYREDD